MSIINLKIIYPDYYREDFMLEVSEQIASILKQSLRNEAAYQRTRRNNKANCYFDSCNEEYMAARSNVYASLEEILDRQIDKQRLYQAIQLLSSKQARRVYAHYILGMSKQEIAMREHVNESCIRESILLAEKNLRKILKTL